MPPAVQPQLQPARPWQWRLLAVAGAVAWPSCAAAWCRCLRSSPSQLEVPFLASSFYRAPLAAAHPELQLLERGRQGCTARQDCFRSFVPPLGAQYRGVIATQPAALLVKHQCTNAPTRELLLSLTSSMLCKKTSSHRQEKARSLAHRLLGAVHGAHAGGTRGRVPRVPPHQHRHRDAGAGRRTRGGHRRQVRHFGSVLLLLMLPVLWHIKWAPNMRHPSLCPVLHSISFHPTRLWVRHASCRSSSRTKLSGY